MGDVIDLPCGSHWPVACGAMGPDLGKTTVFSWDLTQAQPHLVTN